MAVTTCSDTQKRPPPFPWPNMSIWSAETTRLVHDVLLAEDFKPEDLSGFNAQTAIKNMDRLEATPTSNSKSTDAPKFWDGWKTNVDVDIQVPSCEKCKSSERCGRIFTVHGFAYLPASFMEAISKWFHLTPFKRIWKSPLYTSDAWHTAHDDVQKQRREDGCTLERVITGLMFWSDSTHLTQFGHATAWPVYLFFGNLSKYKRASASSGLCHPVAFIPSCEFLPKSLDKFLNGLTNRKNHADLLAHCKRELFHAIWGIMHTEAGIVITCHDGVLRHVYPRIFTYSADYPEKTICGRRYSAARRAIYNLGNPVKGTMVERILKDYSLVPTLNTFAEHLLSFGFDIFSALVVDLMHEFELGVLKSVLKHLIRILYAMDPTLISTLNERFSTIPPFGIDGIRCFPPNVAEMRQRVARHFEDMLQCSIPAFEGLFPAKDDAIIRTLLFRLEVAQRQRRQEARTGSGSPTKSPTSTARPKSFNVHTYKFHALGDYTRTIRVFSTTDSYTTQMVRINFTDVLNKRDVTTGFAKQERQQMHIRRQLGDHTSQEITLDDASPDETELLSELHHVMRPLQRNAFNLASFLRENQSDPAVKNFVPKMKVHLLSRLCGYEYDGDEHSFTDDECNDLQIIGGLNQVIESTILRVNYTTYDIHREQDVMQPGTGCFVMTLSREDEPNAHPFGIVLHVGPNARCRSPQTMELLWVRWLGVEPGYSCSFQEAKLPKVGFVPETDDNAFGFLDPSLMVRGCHLIPSFSDGRTTSLLRQGASVARRPTEDDDWCAFYVNVFADRDMFCRFAGIGVGHEIQYPVRTTPDLNDESGEGDEELDSDIDDDYAHTGRCCMDDCMVADKASDNWDSEEDNSEGDEEFGSEVDYESESAEVDLEEVSDGDASDNENVKF
ncbi:hypothetical protein EDD16DRAFT_1697278 [Pisolithus croceorrhizus]|nr:hypothetical protein EDD16DRAFT_1697278 [Pisolithus croceorrhizus]